MLVRINSRHHTSALYWFTDGNEAARSALTTHHRELTKQKTFSMYASMRKGPNKHQTTQDLHNIMALLR